MGHLLLVAIGWFTAAVAAVAFMSGPGPAIDFAKRGATTAGVTAGAMVGGVKAFTTAFDRSKPAPAKPKPKARNG